ncbi:hypothetical protein X975_08178, partial [Stegodyphus mimosarum]
MDPSLGIKPFGSTGIFGFLQTMSHPLSFVVQKIQF